jgi:hypothetical protein
MNCKIYKDTCCINCLTDENQTEEKLNDYCCSECLIHIAVEHDELLEKGIISE